MSAIAGQTCTSHVCSKRAPGQWAAYGNLILTFTLWGSLYVVSKYVLGRLPVFTISFIRFVLAYLLLVVLTSKSKQQIDRSDWKYLLIIGIVGYFVAIGAQLLGTKYAGPSLASLLNSLNPVTMTVFAAIFLKEKLTLRKIAGLVLALAGVYTILGGVQSGHMAGILLSMTSVLFWSLVSILVRRLSQKYDTIVITKYGTGIAAICYLPISLGEIVMAQPGEIQVNVPCVLGLLYMGLVCTGIAHYLWNKSLSVLEAGTCSAFYPIQPMVSTGLGILLLREKVEAAFFIGAAFIIGGVLLSLTKSKLTKSKNSLHQMQQR